jgi:hypothetical protein
MNRVGGRVAALIAVCGLTVGLVGGCVYNTPQIGHGSAFTAVATVSSTDAWAVGSYNDGQQHPHPLMEHFDGHAWTIVPAPAGTGTGFFGMTAISATDIYALSYTSTLHWNGQRWGVVTDLGGYTLTAIAHGHGGALMAIGFHGPGGPTAVLTHTASGWVPLSTPLPPLPASHRTCDVTVAIAKITLLTPSDAWVSGATTDAASHATCPYAAHWDGSHWTVPPVPDNPGHPGAGLGAISARGPNEVWAIGSTTTFTGPDDRFTSVNGYAVRWNGTSWRTLCNFGCGPDWSDIDATGSAVWVAGNTVFPQDPFTSVRMEIDRWSGNGWVPQPVQTIAPAPHQVPVNTLSSVSVRGGLVVSVGSFVQGDGITLSPLVDQRSDG